MKLKSSILFIIVIIYSSICWVYGETVITFEQIEWNFGIIKEENGKVSHKFHYKNSGNEPLIFSKVTASCGCTTPTYRKVPLEVGGEDDFVITYDPSNRPGRFEKIIILQGNFQSGGIILKIKGVVEPRGRSIEDDYPILLSKGIRLSESQMNFGIIPNNKNDHMSIKIYNASDNVNHVEFDMENIPTWIEPQKGIDIKGKNVGELDINIKPGENFWGRKSYMLPVKINGTRQPIEIYVLADFVEDFSSLSIKEKNEAPYILLSSYFYSFSTSKCGESLVKEFTIQNKGKRSLIIRYIDFNHDNIAVKLSRKEIPVGETAVIKIKVNSDISQDIAESVRIISNDPTYPVRDIKIIANIQ